MEGIVLMPVYNENIDTFQKSLGNIISCVNEAEQSLSNLKLQIFIGIDVDDSISKVQISEYLSCVRRLSNISKYYIYIWAIKRKNGIKRGKEFVLNELFRLSVKTIKKLPDFIISTDVRVNRDTKSFYYLINQLFHSDLRVVGGFIRPYPLNRVQKVLNLSEEQQFYYRFLEIDKDVDIIKILPKVHVRGGLVIFRNWINLPINVVDDYWLTRAYISIYGRQTVKVDYNAIGYYISRYTFENYFVTKFSRRKLTYNLSSNLSQINYSDLQTENIINRLYTVYNIPKPKMLMYIQKKLLDACVYYIIDNFVVDRISIKDVDDIINKFSLDSSITSTVRNIIIEKLSFVNSILCNKVPLSKYNINNRVWIDMA